MLWSTRTDRRNGLGTLELAKDATARLPHVHGGLVVEVRQGAVVVTREGDPEDHILVAGEALALPSRGLAVAWALSPSCVALQTRPVAAPMNRPLTAAAGR